MEIELKTIVALIIGGAGLLPQIAITIRTGYRQRQIPKMATEDLKALFHKASNFTLFNLATKELQKRGEDILFTFPIYLHLALSDKSVLQLIGKGCLIAYFKDKLPSDINLQERRMSETTREQLRTAARLT